MKTRDIIGTIIIVIGSLVILDLFVPFLDMIFDLISFDVIFGAALIVIGILIIRSHENKIEDRKDKKDERTDNNNDRKRSRKRS